MSTHMMPVNTTPILLLIPAEELAWCKNGHHGGVYYSLDTDNFYCSTCRVGMGNGFYQKHILQLKAQLGKLGPVLLKRVVIESPFSGDVERNRIYLDRAIRDSLRRGESPFASHRMYTSALDDGVVEERELGMKAGFAWRSSAFATVVYEDYGISGGMAEGIEDARAISQQIERRTIGLNP